MMHPYADRIARLERSYSISLQIRHPLRTRDWIEERIGLAARYWRNVGETRPGSDDRDSGINPETFCAFELLPKQNGWFTDGIITVVPLLTDRRHALREILGTGGDAALHVDAFTDGRKPTAFKIEPMVLAALGAAALRVSVEIHPD